MPADAGQGLMERKGVHMQAPATRTAAGSRLRAQAHVPVGAEAFTRQQRGQNREITGEVSTAPYVPSDEARRGLRCVTPAPQPKVNPSLGAETLEGQHLYLLKGVARILPETRCLSAGYTGVRAALAETTPEGWERRAPFPHGHVNVQRPHTAMGVSVPPGPGVPTGDRNPDPQSWDDQKCPRHGPHPAAPVSANARFPDLRLLRGGGLAHLTTRYSHLLPSLRAASV